MHYSDKMELIAQIYADEYILSDNGQIFYLEMLFSDGFRFEKEVL